MSHYFSKKQDSALDLKTIDVVIDNKEYIFYTGSGVFSKSKVDYGTKVLAKYMRIGSKDSVLDLGCGIGIIGVVAAGKTRGRIVCVDINSRAVKLAKMNAKRYGNIIVMQSDQYEAVSDDVFDVILLNPPQTAGKKVCMDMIKGAKDHLKKGGSLQIVARHNKGGEGLSKYMEEIYGNMETLCRKGGYRVYLSVNEE